MITAMMAMTAGLPGRALIAGPTFNLAKVFGRYTRAATVQSTAEIPAEM